VLIGPVRYFTLDFVWRFLTDPISHACWSGLTGYFIGLAVTRRRQWYAVAWTGLAAAAVLHGLNDWGRAALLRWVRCPGAGHPGLGGNTRSFGTSGRSRAIRRNRIRRGG
jgi:hypothetical protein